MAGTRRLAFVVCMAIAACSRAPRIDGSSQDAFAQSIAAMRTSLPPDSSQGFDYTIEFIATGDVGTGKFDPLLLTGTPAAELRARLNGRTRKQIRELADSLARIRRIAEMGALRKAKIETDSLKRILEGLTISGADWAVRDIDHEPTVMIGGRLENRTPFAVRMIDARAALFAPGQTEPIFQSDNVMLLFNGIVQPGQSAPLDGLDVTSTWPRTVPSGTVLRLTPIGLSTPTDPVLVNPESFKMFDEHRLAELEHWADSLGIK